MRRSARILMLVAALALLPAGCDETVTEPEEEEITYGALIIYYEADAGSAESGEISPETGGTVSATGPDGVTYTLEVSPNAVASSTIVTITTLSELSISSIDLTHVDTSVCIVGALFEPEDLDFDATVNIHNDGTGILQYQWENNAGGDTWSQTAILNILISASFQ